MRFNLQQLKLSQLAIASHTFSLCDYVAICKCSVIIDTLLSKKKNLKCFSSFKGIHFFLFHHPEFYLFQKRGLKCFYWFSLISSIFLFFLRNQLQCRVYMSMKATDKAQRLWVFFKTKFRVFFREGAVEVLNHVFF